MAVTKTQDDKKTTTETKTKATKHKNMEDLLVEELSKFYGVEFNKDEDKFIKECNEAALKDAKEDQQDDPIEAAKYSEKLGQLRKLWADTDGKKETPEQKALREQLEEEYPEAALSFPTETSWMIQLNGKEDTGHISGVAGALASAERMKNPA